jgi:hypothetical protein
MARYLPKAAFACIALAVQMSAGQVPNISGTWTLNVEKSKWGNTQKPVTASVEVDHQEPKLKYTGQVVYTGDDSRKYAFDGAIDGKDYSANPSYGTGKISLKRVNAYTFDSVFKTDDGKIIETTRTVVSHDGKVMTRSIHLQGAQDRHWTEIYEKK